MKTKKYSYWFATQNRLNNESKAPKSYQVDWISDLHGGKTISTFFDRQRVLMCRDGMKMHSANVFVEEYFFWLGALVGVLSSRSKCLEIFRND